ncbi:MAG: hypothetical protein J6Y78_00935 [Paludibacteraceae bacterium]|nr:hypothetical protein [Paludibacteraceae bacterium]
MIKIDRETKEKRNAEYNTKARKYPAYLSLAIPIMLGIAMGAKDLAGTSMWIKALSYLFSISTISAALLFLLRFSLQSIAMFYPERILFCDRLKPTTRILYSNDNSYTEEQKADIRKKIIVHKNIDLQKYKPKTYKNKKYVKRVDEAVRWLLDVTRFDEILFEKNCLYGFWRNLTAALLVDAILMFVLAAINKWYFALPLGEYLVGIGILVLLLTIPVTWVAYCNGKTFAKKMYDVFMNMNDNEIV